MRAPERELEGFRERERASERDCERDLLRVRDTGERESARGIPREIARGISRKSARETLERE